MKKLIILLFVVGSTFSVTGCKNTADGIVDDTERNIDKVEDAAN